MKVRERLLPSGRVGFVADFGESFGRRRRVLCRSRAEARALMSLERRRVLAIRAMPMAGPALSDAVEALVDAVEARGRSEKTTENLRSRLGLFTQALGPGRPIGTVLSAEVDAYVRGLSRGNRPGSFRVIRQLFRYAVRREWALRDATLSLDPPPVPRPGIPTIFSPGEVDRLLACAAACIFPYLAVGLFAGLRPGELEALDWSEVDLQGRTILVLPETSKVRRARYVPICDRLAALLAPVARESGPVSPADARLRRWRRRACASAGVAWSADVMRHTYATMRLASDSPQTTAQDMGTSEAMLWRHYRGLARAEDAKTFWLG